MKNRIKENTWHIKEHIIRTKILPYFDQRKISDRKMINIRNRAMEIVNTELIFN